MSDRVLSKETPSATVPIDSPNAVSAPDGASHWQGSRPARTGTWTESALRVFGERYLWRRPDGVVETPEDLCWRVATAIAAVEQRHGANPKEMRALAEAFYTMMVDCAFLPNSPTLMNAGRDNGLQYSACYVLPVTDSMEGIFDAVKRAALIHQSGGGTGFAFSRLRARGAVVASTGGRASGPVSFMSVFNAATEAVKQGGTRRGANMGVLRVDHPDIEAFIACKLDGGMANFNLSVAATTPFMHAVQEDREVTLTDHLGNATRTVPARAIFDQMVHAAWRTGDPGLVFIDRVNASPANPIPELSRIEATNPCGEQPLAPNEACNLGSLNLMRFLRADSLVHAPPSDRIDWERLQACVTLAVRFLDDVIEANPYPLPEIRQMVEANRRIGLGVMGWADLLMALDIPYDSLEALALAETLMARVNGWSHDASRQLATRRGPFPNWPHSIYRDGPPLRNATVTTIAPTGTISILAGCSSGIEPVFALAFRHVVGARELTFLNPVFEDALHRLCQDTDGVREHVARTGSVRDAVALPEALRRVFVTAHEIAGEWHIRMQAAFQRHTDNGVSKTVNLPHDAAEMDVARAFMLAWEAGCLGITVFRDGCKDAQVLYAGAGTATAAARDNGEEATGAASGPVHDTEPPPALATRALPRPRRVEGATYRIASPLGPCYVTVNHNDQGAPFEVFSTVGKAGSDIAADSEAMGRLISLVLRLPSPFSARERVEEIVDQLRGIGGARHAGFGRHRVRSLPDAIAQALAEYLGPADPSSDRAQDLCPDCGHATLVYEEGCQNCHSCGYSVC